MLTEIGITLSKRLLILDKSGKILSLRVLKCYPQGAEAIQCFNSFKAKVDTFLIPNGWPFIASGLECGAEITIRSVTILLNAEYACELLLLLIHMIGDCGIEFSILAILGVKMFLQISQSICLVTTLCWGLLFMFFSTRRKHFLCIQTIKTYFKCLGHASVFLSNEKSDTVCSIFPCNEMAAEWSDN